MGNCCRASGEKVNKAGSKKKTRSLAANVTSKASAPVTYSHSPSPPPYFPAKYPYNHANTNSLSKYSNYKNKNVKNALAAAAAADDDDDNYAYEKANPNGIVREEDIERSVENLAVDEAKFGLRKRPKPHQEQPPVASTGAKNYQLIAVSLTPQSAASGSGKKLGHANSASSRRGADNSQIITHLNSSNVYASDCDIESLSASPSCTRAKLMSYQKLQKQQLKTSGSPCRPAPNRTTITTTAAGGVAKAGTKNIFEEINTFNSQPTASEQDAAPEPASNRLSQENDQEVMALGLESRDQVLLELESEPVRMRAQHVEHEHSTPKSAALSAEASGTARKQQTAPSQASAALKASPVPTSSSSPASSSPIPDSNAAVVAAERGTKKDENGTPKPPAAASKTIFVLRKKNKLASPSLNTGASKPNQSLNDSNLVASEPELKNNNHSGSGKTKPLSKGKANKNLLAAKRQAENELDESAISSSSSIGGGGGANASFTAANVSGSGGGGFSSIFNWKNYRSLQKSKQSIKNLEDSMKLSHSIEQWLNDFGKIQMSGVGAGTTGHKRRFGSMRLNNRLNTNSSKKLRTQLFRDDDGGHNGADVLKSRSKNARLSVLNEREISIEIEQSRRELPPAETPVKMKDYLRMDEDEDKENRGVGQLSHQQTPLECRYESEDIEDGEEMDQDESSGEEEDELENDVFRSDAQFKLFLEQLLRTCSKLTTATSLNNSSLVATPPASAKKSKKAAVAVAMATPTTPLSRASSTSLALASSINVIKLVDTIGLLMKYNHARRLELLEREMSAHMSKFFVPKSDDVTDLLKWLLTDKNFELSLCRPVFNESVLTPDHLTRCQQVNNVFLMVARGLNVRLVEAEAVAYEQHTELAAETSVDEFDDLGALCERLEREPARLNSDAFYLRFEMEPELDDVAGSCHVGEPVYRGKLAICSRLVRKALNNEKKLVEKCSKTIEMNFESLDEQEEFAQRQQEHLETYRQVVLGGANFRGAQCLLNIKKRQSLNRRTLTSVNLNSLRNSQQPTNGSAKRTSGSFAKRQSQQPAQKQHQQSKGARVGGGGSNNSSTITTTSSQCSTPSPSSPSSSASSSAVSTESTPSSKAASPVYNPINKLGGRLSGLQTSASLSADNYVAYSELNERLFACLLSNFSCQLVESFLGNNALNGCAAQLQTGFIRKQAHEKSFMCVNIAEDGVGGQARQSTKSATKLEADADAGVVVETPNNNAGKFQLNLSVDTNTIKLCLRLDRWPKCFERSFFGRERSLTRWPSRKLLEHLAKSACLISYHARESSEFSAAASSTVSHGHTGLLTTLDHQQQQRQHSNSNDAEEDYVANPFWQVDTRLAELTLFKYLSQTHKFLFYYFYLLFNNLSVEMTSAYEQLARLDNVPSEHLQHDGGACSTTFHLFDFVNERIFLHHFFRFLELYQVETNQSAASGTLGSFIMLIDSIRKFSEHLRSVLDAHGSLNRPNYFDLDKSILEAAAYESLLVKANLVNRNLEDVRKFTDCSRQALLNTLNGFEQLLQSSLYAKLGLKAALTSTAFTAPTTASSKDPSAFLNALNTFLELTRIRLTLNSQASRSMNASAMTLSPLLLNSTSSFAGAAANGLKSASKHVLLEKLIEKQTNEFLLSRSASKTTATTGVDSSSVSGVDNDSTGDDNESMLVDGVSPFSPLAPHFSTSTFVYEYIFEFVRELYEHFRTKRDNFKINEQLLLDIHESVIKHNLSTSTEEPSGLGGGGGGCEEDQHMNQSLEMNEFIRSIQAVYYQNNNNSNQGGRPGKPVMINGYLADGLLMRKYEEYAECVHKYLPQVRQHNKFLLFHYVWTMQVQYLAPFFNYLCDSFASFGN